MTSLNYELGIYAVQFQGPQGPGQGVVVIDDASRVRGGDHGYFYSGHIKQQGEGVSIDLKVVRHTNSTASVFGPLTDFVINFRGQVGAGNKLNLQGQVAGVPGQISANARLVEATPEPAS